MEILGHIVSFRVMCPLFLEVGLIYRLRILLTVLPPPPGPGLQGLQKRTLKPEAGGTISHITLQALLVDQNKHAGLVVQPKEIIYYLVC